MSLYHVTYRAAVDGAVTTGRIGVDTPHPLDTDRGEWAQVAIDISRRLAEQGQAAHVQITDITPA